MCKDRCPCTIEMTDVGQFHALLAVLEERKAQDVKWSEQNHDALAWLAILVEEVGEFSKAILEEQWIARPPTDVRKEAVQVAAVALAIVECCDRNNWVREDAGG